MWPVRPTRLQAAARITGSTSSALSRQLAQKFGVALEHYSSGHPAALVQSRYKHPSLPFRIPSPATIPNPRSITAQSIRHNASHKVRTRHRHGQLAPLRPPRVEFAEAARPCPDRRNKEHRKANIWGICRVLRAAQGGKGNITGFSMSAFKEAAGSKARYDPWERALVSPDGPRTATERWRVSGLPGWNDWT